MTKNNCEELNQMIKKLQGQLIQKDKKIALNKQIIAQKEQIIADNKQIINQQIKKDKIFTKSICIEPSIYKDYDDKQNGMEEEEELDNKAYEKEYQAFLKSINLINIKEEPKKKGGINRSDIIKHKIGETLKLDKFVEAFKKAIEENVNIYWSKIHKVELKTILLNSINIKKIFYNDVPKHIKQLKMDILLCLVLEEGLEDSNNIDILLNIENFTRVPLNKGIPFKSPKKSTQMIFDKQFIISQITNNIGIMNGYNKMLQKFVGKSIKYWDLKKKIIQIIQTSNIYFFDCPENICGLTICNGDIFIKGQYLKESTNKNYDDLYRFIGIAKIYLTLIHEFAHKLHYVVRAEENIIKYRNYFIKTFIVKADTDLNFDNYFYITVDFNETFSEKTIKPLTQKDFQTRINYKNLHSEPTECESADFFDEEIYLGNVQNYVSKKLCEFFLLYSCNNYREYVKIMDYLQKEKEKRPANFKYKSIQNGIGECFMSFIRRKVYY